MFPPGDAVALAVPASHAERQFAARPTLERSIDAVAPAVSEAIVERWRAGSGLVAAQSDCPFQALAARRWRADPWPDPIVGLTPMEREVFEGILDGASHLPSAAGPPPAVASTGPTKPTNPTNSTIPPR